MIVKVLIRGLAIVLALCASSSTAQLTGTDSTVWLDLSDMPFGQSDKLLKDLRANGALSKTPSTIDFSRLDQVQVDPGRASTVLDDLIVRNNLAPDDIRGMLRLDDIDSAPGLYGLANIIDPRAHPVGPETTKDNLNQLREIELQRCNLDQACLTKVEKQFDDALVAVGGVPKSCQQAAEAYNRRESYRLANDTTLNRIEVAKAAQALDLPCLKAPWDVNLPDVLGTSGVRIPEEGALAAIALIMIKGSNIPFCTGVFLRPDLVVTARHCFGEASKFDALKAGNIQVIQAGGSKSAKSTRYSVGAVPEPDLTLRGREVVPTSDDYIRLQIAGVHPVTPSVLLAQADRMTPVVVAGYYRYYNSARVAARSTAEQLSAPWWDGIRVLTPDRCYILTVQPGCVRMACSTVHGFSGAPIFSAETPGAKGPLKFYGIIEGSEGGVDTCGAEPFHDITVGVTKLS